MNKTKVFQTIDQYYDICREVKKECVSYLAEVAKYWGKDGFPLLKISREFDVIESDVCVVYDGGNHPEYASNACSEVYTVFANDNGMVSLHTEDCADYEQDRIETVDFTSLVEGVDAALRTITEELLKLLCPSFDNNEKAGVMTISSSDYSLITSIKVNEDIKEWFRDQENWEYDEFCHLINPKALAPLLCNMAEVEGDTVRWEWK